MCCVPALFVVCGKFTKFISFKLKTISQLIMGRAKSRPDLPIDGYPVLTEAHPFLRKVIAYMEKRTDWLGTVTEEPSDNEISDMNSETEIFENKDHWPDVAELVNLSGDETTVYLLADGRYMDRINAIYMFDGKDTWTDEAGVEWNEVVK